MTAAGLLNTRSTPPERVRLVTSARDETSSQEHVVMSNKNRIAHTKPLPGRDLPCSPPSRGERYIQLVLPGFFSDAGDDSGSGWPPNGRTDDAPTPADGEAPALVRGRDEPRTREVEGP